MCSSRPGGGYLLLQQVVAGDAIRVEHATGIDDLRRKADIAAQPGVHRLDREQRAIAHVTADRGVGTGGREHDAEGNSRLCGCIGAAPAGFPFSRNAKTPSGKDLPRAPLPALAGLPPSYVGTCFTLVFVRGCRRVAVPATEM